MPKYATLSQEVDILPKKDSNGILADMLHARAGQDSAFDFENNFYLDGVDDKTATLPRGWQKRVVRVEARVNPAAIGLCLDPVDLCVAKLAANREKDIRYVNDLITHGFVDPIKIRQRLSSLEKKDIRPELRRQIRNWLTSYIEKNKSSQVPQNTENKVTPTRPCRAKDPAKCRVHGKN